MINFIKIKFLYINIKYLLIKLKKGKMSKTEFIWYCKRKSCNMIITKTADPHLDSKKIYRCKVCNEKYRGDVLMILNKENIEKTINRISRTC